MRIPFTAEQFLDLFARYNAAIWPAQAGAYALGLAALLLAVRGGPAATRAVPALLAGAWLFVGATYHLLFFVRLNPAAWLFGALFLVEAALLAWAASRRRLEFGFLPSPAAVAGLFLVAYAAVLYPLLGALLGHRYPRAPAFGVTPCPTTIFTLGVLLLAQSRVPRRLLVVPLLWALVGASAALQLGIREDLGLVLAGLLALPLLRRAPSPFGSPTRAA